MSVPELLRRIEHLEQRVDTLQRRGRHYSADLFAPLMGSTMSGGGKIMWSWLANSPVLVHGGSGLSAFVENNISGADYRRTDFGAPYVDLDGINEYLSVGDAAWQEPGALRFLVWGWCYPADISASRTIAAKWVWSTDNRSWALDYNQPTADFRFRCCDTGLVGDVKSVLSTYGAVALYKWYFVAGYFQPSTLMRIYVGCADEASLTVDSNTTSIPASLYDGVAPLTIGADGNPAVYFQGRISMAMGLVGVSGISADIDDYATTIFQTTKNFHDEEV